MTRYKISTTVAFECAGCHDTIYVTVLTQNKHKHKPCRNCNSYIRVTVSPEPVTVTVDGVTVPHEITEELWYEDYS